VEDTVVGLGIVDEGVMLGSMEKLISGSIFLIAEKLLATDLEADYFSMVNIHPLLSGRHLENPSSG
jgi:hypothetical protein